MRTFLMVFNLFRLTGYVTDPMLDNHEVHAVVGEPARLDAAPPADGQLKIVSWNIAQGTKYTRVLEALKSMDADVYLLQEVDRGVRRSDYRDVARDLAHELGMNWVFAGEFQEIGQSRGSVPAVTGQAVLSRYRIDDPRALRFENQANLRWKLDPLQPRRGGRMALRAETGGVIIYNAHIESARNDGFRHRQVDEMLADHDRDGRSSVPVVFAGDFNTGRIPSESPIVQCLTEEGFVDALAGFDTPRRTSIHHEQPLDWIFARNLQPRVGRVVPVAKASDHFPLEAAFSMRRTTIVAP